MGSGTDLVWYRPGVVHTWGGTDLGWYRPGVVQTRGRDWRIMLDIKPDSAFLSARNSAQQVVNSAQYSAEILLWLLILSRHFPTHATRKYLGTIQHSRYQDQVGQFCGNDATHSLGPSN